MRIRRVSKYSGVERFRELDITEAELEAWAFRGVLIQDAMPRLSADEREFVLTGITPEEWDEIFGEEI